ncbi:conserved membrane hypothetical protein [uncultured delta proteobacterium]|uniref:MATE efflux family protein n=1 Tax=uncultured delta proteobacterium TaxID=34034 RepID=A0A212K9M1_9DELT|nr:conserved membrane hypothetical protein [uncultured delta proteobacterium]
MNTHELDLTKGNVLRTLARFSIPILATNILQSLYSMADMLVVGHFVGDTGLAAISNASMLVFLITSFSIGFSMGGNVLVARCKGAGDTEGQNLSVSVLFASMFLLSLVVTVATLAGYGPLFRLMEVPDEALTDANEYMRILSVGIVFVFGYNAVSAILRGLGDSINPLRFAVAATVLNIVLDLLFVGWLGFGTKGAAIATVISQGGAFFIGLQDLRKRGLLSGLKAAGFTEAKSKLTDLVRVGVPYAAQMVVVNFSYLVITGMINTYGLTVAAAAGVGLKINTFAAMPCWAIGQAVTAMTAQNIGAGNIGRVRQVVRKGLLCSLTATGILVLLVQVFAGQVIMLFGQSEQGFVDAGVQYLRVCCSVNCLFYVTMYTLDSFAVGAGAPRLALFNSLLDSLVLRLPFIWILEVFLAQGLAGIYLGQALAPVVPAIIGLVFFLGNTWVANRQP